MTIPRRCFVELDTTAEKAIGDAIDAVEGMGVDLRLSDAVFVLMRARASVSNYVDGVPRRVNPDQTSCPPGAGPPAG